MTKEIQSPNVEMLCVVPSLVSSFGFRHSSFGFENYSLFNSKGWSADWWEQPGSRWLIESSVGLTTVHWDHEPQAFPRPTESADKSDALQTLRALRRRPAVAERLECVRLQRRFPKPRYDSMTGQVHGKGGRPMKGNVSVASPRLARNTV